MREGGAPAVGAPPSRGRRAEGYGAQKASVNRREAFTSVAR